MFFAFKQDIKDFIVEEVLGFELDGEGDFLYIFFEKREKNTMDIVEKLIARFKLKRHQLGISGLKDKKGITRQWISIGKNTLAQIGGKDAFVQYLSKEVKIIKEAYHNDILKVGQHSGNRFEIRLRARADINPLLKKQLEHKLGDIKENGFANYFGMQRFGKGLKNWKRAVKVFDGGAFDPEDHHLRFQLQSRVSMHFNRLLQQRIEQNIDYLDGDILMKGNNAWRAEAAILEQDKVIPFDYKLAKQQNEDKDFFFAEGNGSPGNLDGWIVSGPLLGYNILLPKHGSAAFDFERKYLQEISFLIDPVKVCQHVGIYGIRRPYRAFPEQLEYARDNDDVIIKFGLPTGAYATVLLAALFQKVEAKTYEANFKLPL